MGSYVCKIENLEKLIDYMNSLVDPENIKKGAIEKIKENSSIKWYYYCDNADGNTIRLYDSKFRNNNPELYLSSSPNSQDYYVILRGHRLGDPDGDLKKNIRIFLEEQGEPLKNAAQEGLSTNQVKICLDYFEKRNRSDGKTGKGNGGKVELENEQDSIKYKELERLTYLKPSFFKKFENLLLEHRQVILEGPPGSGKTYVAETFAEWWIDPEKSGAGRGSISKVIQFHESYGYEDFFQGIRPVLLDSEGLEIKLNDTTKHCHSMVYKNVNGIFYNICADAEENKNARFVLIIDEINRGKTSRIFGELLYLLEYRDKKIKLASGEDFSIPENVYIIGTMNTADRSIALVDYALRRRFKFVNLHPVCFENGEAPVLKGWLDNNDIKEAGDIVKIFLELNRRITEVNEHFIVGHSYFMTKKLKENPKEVLREIWEFSIVPLMAEYQPHLSSKELKERFGIDAISAECGVTL